MQKALHKLLSFKVFYIVNLVMYSKLYLIHLRKKSEFLIMEIKAELTLSRKFNKLH